MPAEYTALIDWDGDGDFDDPTEDVTERVLAHGDVSIEYGRDQARATSPTRVGEAGFLLNNVSRDYSPDNTSSPLAGNVRPGRPVKFDARVPYSEDAFGRTVSNGWGGVWSVAGSAAQYSVNGSSALMATNATNTQFRALTGVTVRDFDAYATVTCPVTPTGAGLEAAILGRWVDTSNLIDARIFYLTTGAVTCAVRQVVGGTETFLGFPTVTGVTATSAIRLRFQAYGTLIRLKAWLASAAEPDAWNVELATDYVTAGNLGLMSVRYGGNTNGTVSMAFDNWSAALNTTMYRGYLDDYDVLPDIADRSVKVSCVDQLARLRGVKITTGLHHGLQTGAAVGIVLDAAGWDPDLRDLDQGATTIPWFWADDQDAYELLSQILDSEGPGSLLTINGDGAIVFRSRHHRITSPTSVTSQTTLRDGGTEPLYSAMVYDHGWKEIVNSVAFSVPIRTLAGEPAAVWSTEGQIAIADGDTLPVSAKASSPFAGAVVPVQDTDYTLLSGTVSMTLSARSGQSTTVFITATGGPAVIAGLQVRAYALETVTTRLVTAEESTSIDRYGRRSLPSQRDPVWAGIHDAAAIADLILAQRAERLPTVTITVRDANDARLVQQLSLDLSDRIHVVETQTGLDDDFHIEQISHRISHDGKLLETRFGCEKVPDAPTGLLILGSATEGILGTGRLGGVGYSDPTRVFILGDSGQGVLGTGVLGV